MPRVQLTEEEKAYLDGQPPRADAAFEIFLCRVLGRPLKEMEELANEVDQAVQRHYLGES